MNLGNAAWLQRYIALVLLFIACNSHGQWTKVSPYTPNQDISEIKFTATGLGWIVGSKGKIARLNNGQWQEFYSGTSARLYGLHILGDSDIWAVGEQGIILHYNGNGWNVVPAGTFAKLYDVCFADATHGWAVGENGIVLFYNGVSWTAQPSGTTNTLYAVDFSDPEHGWAGGDYGQILKYDGNSWSSVYVSGNQNSFVWRIETIDSTEAWLIGSPTKHYVNGSWATVSLNIQNPRGLHFPDENNGWICGASNDIKYNNGTSWTALPNLPTSLGGASSLFFTSPTNGYVAFDKGGVFHFNGTGWQCISGVSYSAFNNVQVIHESSIYCLNSASNLTEVHRYLAHYNGQQWSLQQNAFSPNSLNAYDLEFLAADDGWASFSGGKVRHYDGVSWTLQSTGGTDDIYALSFINTGQGWGAGEHTIVKYANNTWSIELFDTAFSLLDVFMLDASTGWAAGADGKILKYNGSVWLPEVTPTNEYILKLFFTDATHGWAVGNNGLILKYDGNVWVQQNLANPYAFRAIYFTDNDHGRIAYANGQFLVYDSGNWTLESADFSSAVLDMYFWDAEHGIAVGENGLILEYDATTVRLPGVVSNDVSINVFPNPGNVFSIRMAGSANQTVAITLYDLHGALVYHSYNLLKDGINTLQPATSNLACGVYFVEVKSNSLSTKMKWIKQ